MKILMTSLIALAATSASAGSYSRISPLDTGGFRVQDDVAETMFRTLSRVRESKMNSVQGDIITSRSGTTIDCVMIEHVRSGLETEYVCLFQLKDDGEFKNPLTISNP